AMLDNIRVEYYGSATPIKQLAQIGSPRPPELGVRPLHGRDLKENEKANPTPELGLAPHKDGKVIPLLIPAIDGEHEAKLVKRVKELAEDAKVACRNVRRDANKHFEQAEKDGELTEDERDQGKEEVQKLLKTYEGNVEELADKKSAEIMEQ